MEDFDFDDSLLAALDNYEKQHVTGSTNGSNPNNVLAGSAQPGAAKQHVAQQQDQQQQQQSHAPTAGARQPLQAVQPDSIRNVGRDDRPASSGHSAAQHQQAPNINQIWGLFCNGPPAPGSSSCSGWASKRLQRRYSGAPMPSKTHQQQRQQQGHQQQRLSSHGQPWAASTTTHHQNAAAQQYPGQTLQPRSQQWNPAAGHQPGEQLQPHNQPQQLAPQPWQQKQQWQQQQQHLAPPQQGHAAQHSMPSQLGVNKQGQHLQSSGAAATQRPQQQWAQQQQQQQQGWQQQQQQQQQGWQQPSWQQQQQQQQQAWQLPPQPGQLRHNQQEVDAASIGQHTSSKHALGHQHHPQQQQQHTPANQDHDRKQLPRPGDSAVPISDAAASVAAAAGGDGAVDPASHAGMQQGCPAAHSTPVPVGAPGASSSSVNVAAGSACSGYSGAGAASGGAAPAGPAAASGGHPAAAAAAGASGGPVAAAAASGGHVAGATAAGISGGPAAAAAGGGASGGVSGGAALYGGDRGGASGGPAAVSGGPVVLYDAKLGLGREGLIEVSFSGWHDQIAAVCRSIPGCSKAGGSHWGRSWLLPSDQLNALQQALEDNLPSNVRVRKFEPLPDLVRNVLAAAGKRPDDTQLFEALTEVELAPGVTLADRMRPFQREGVNFGLRAGGRVLIGDEMGLGKTVQACALAKCYQAEWPVLVVTPSSLRLSWATALYQWLRVTEDRVLVTLKVNDMQHLKKAQSEEQARNMVVSRYDFVIVSYDMLKDVADVLGAVNFKMVILDESHCIKNPTAQRTKFAKPLVERAARAVLLSGTPALSNPSELLTQLQALLPKARITKTAFEERYVDTRQCHTFRKVVGYKNTEELNRLLTSTIMIRRKKAEVLKDLPAKNRDQVPLLLDASSLSQLEKLKNTLKEVQQLTGDMHGVGKSAGGGVFAGMEQQQRNMVMQLWHDTARIKGKAVTDYIKELLMNSSTDDKFLIFAYHRDLMDAIEKGVNDIRSKNKECKNMRYMRIDGETPARQREENVTAFQNDENCRVGILNIKAAGVGLTLTRASTVVFAELAWTPSEIQQAEDRAHRIGQTQCVNVKFLLVKGSIDDLMMELLHNKLATTGQVLDGQATRMEMQKASSQPAKGGRAASGGPRNSAAEQAPQTQKPQQPSITNFFGTKGGGPASKKQRTT